MRGGQGSYSRTRESGLPIPTRSILHAQHCWIVALHPLPVNFACAALLDCCIASFSDSVALHHFVSLLIV